MYAAVILLSALLLLLVSSPIRSTTTAATALATTTTTTTTMSSTETCKRKRVLVIGANGQTGFRVVRLLARQQQQQNKDNNSQQHYYYQPVAMIRDVSQRSKFDELNVPWIVGDLDDGGSPTVQDMDGIDVVIFAAGAGRNRPPIKKVTIDYLSAVRSMVVAQQSESVQRYILLSGINTDPLGTRRSKGATGSDLEGPLSAWHRLKAHSETYLKELHLHGRPLDWTILCPGRLLDDTDGKPGTGLVKCSLIHGEDDLKNSLSEDERKASIKVMPGRHDGKSERLCISRDNVAATLVGLLYAPNNVNNKSITVVDGIAPVHEALESI